ncbi:MAG: hypothetical protein A2046_07370 [Bacteroidetes bacterium GWA2_30_7]|nr:MAG: hypothetical protein A2046_07370 [Bacteroidetes bacterium GWA2_30_7]
MKILSKFLNLSLKILKWFFGIIGLFSFLLFILSFTDIPYFAYHWLGTSNSELTCKPDIIVILGGAGMPSPDGLIRTYYATQAAQQFIEAKIIIALPYNEEDSLFQLNLMANELIIKGIDSSRIQYEPLGFNTYSQATNIASTFAIQKNKLSLLLVTSPEHMYRSVKTFQKAGFANVGGIPTFEKPVDEEKVLDKSNTNDIRIKSLSVRYNMWSYLNYELLTLREYCAIAYYKMKGWI